MCCPRRVWRRWLCALDFVNHFLLGGYYWQWLCWRHMEQDLEG